METLRRSWFGGCGFDFTDSVAGVTIAAIGRSLQSQTCWTAVGSQRRHSPTNACDQEEQWEAIPYPHFDQREAIVERREYVVDGIERDVLGAICDLSPEELNVDCGNGSCERNLDHKRECGPASNIYLLLRGTKYANSELSVRYRSVLERPVECMMRNREDDAD